MTPKNHQKQTFEESLHRLEEIVNKLEQGEVPLEDSIKIYEEGLALSKACLERLTQAELKLKKLSKNIDGSFQLLDEEDE
ncbi:MAG: exodeoxyribonuclease VII small subunit [Bacteroidota bacterium]